MKYRIVEIDPQDSFYEDREVLVGKIIETDPTYGVYHTVRSFMGGRFLIHDTITITFNSGNSYTKDAEDYIFFFRVRLEPVQENN